MFLYGLGYFKANKAIKDLKPTIAVIEKERGKRICDDGNNGAGINKGANQTYTAYYSVPESNSLINKINDVASKEGYKLDAEKLETLAGATDSFRLSYNWRNGPNTRETIIYKNTSVNLYCDISEDKSVQHTGKNLIVILRQLTSAP